MPSSLRAFISGEFAASFGWQIYYYTVKTFQVNHAKSVQWVLLVVVYAVIFGILYLLEKYLQKGGKEIHTWAVSSLFLPYSFLAYYWAN